MNIYNHIKNLIHTYKKIDSPSKKIFHYGASISFVFFAITLLLYIFTYFSTNYSFENLIYQTARFSINLFVLSVVAMFVFDIVVGGN